MNTNRTSMELVSDNELVITRTFRARPSIVFDAWTKPEYLRRWWHPRRGVVLVECEADLRPGGAYRYAMARGEERYVFYGEYKEIVRPSRLVYTQIFEPFPDSAVIVTVTFEDRAGATKLVAHELYPSKEVREAALASGMEDGMRETYEQLDELVASLDG
jgi:uncharacterized protein YndB with AHSA1/START domain